MKKFLFDLFPVIIFFIAYKLGDANTEATRHLLQSVGLPQPTGMNEKPGIYLATFVAIIASVAQIAWVKLRGHKVETMLWVSLGIILVFGGATLWLHDESFIKWKPTVLYWVFAGAIFGAALFGRNLIRGLMDAQMELPEVAWSRLNLSWGGFFAIMGVVNLWVAFNYSTDDWVNFKLFGSMGLMLVFVIAQGMMLSRYMDKEENQ
jgi:intracellular septation protein